MGTAAFTTTTLGFSSLDQCQRAAINVNDGHTNALRADLFSLPDPRVREHARTTNVSVLLRRLGIWRRAPDEC
jgi:hypothetical protein